jgi:hypothetical protein
VATTRGVCAGGVAIGSLTCSDSDSAVATSTSAVTP